MARKRFISEAAAAALTHYGPELTVLKQLMSEAGTSYRQKVHSAQAGASAIEASSARATEQLKGIYGNSPIAGIPGLSRAQAIGDMIGRGVAAQESAAGARRTALQELSADRAKINTRRTDLAQELGAFTASESGRLSQAAAQRDLTNRISLRGVRSRESEGAKNRANAVRTAKIRASKAPTRTANAAKAFETRYGVKPLSREQHNAKRSEIDRTLALVKDQITKGSDRKRIAGLLVNGRPAIKGTASDGTQQSLPAIKAVDPLVASAALDMAFDSYVSDRNAHELHTRGFSVKALGLPGATERARRDREKARRQARARRDRTRNALANAFGPFGTPG